MTIDTIGKIIWARNHFSASDSFEVIYLISIYGVLSVVLSGSTLQVDTIDLI